MNVPRTVLLSRPDALGDAMVTMTTAGWIKHHAPSTRIIVLAKRYTLPVWKCCSHADEVLVLEDLQELGDEGATNVLREKQVDAVVHVFPHRQVARWTKMARIPRRIGTSHRWWHWFTCNERVGLSRKNSTMHEAQLNIQLLAPFALPMPNSVSELIPHIGYRSPVASPEVRALLRTDRTNIVLHPLLGSGVGWGLENIADLIRALDPQRYHCLLTGTATEAQRYRTTLPLSLPHVTDTGGKLPLEKLLELIGACDGFVSASTGPLHVAAASGVKAIGLFSMRTPIWPARWAPLGTNAHFLVHDHGCQRCASGADCDCIQRIQPRRVIDLLVH
jgi:heptosyltransferase III